MIRLHVALRAARASRRAAVIRALAAADALVIEKKTMAKEVAPVAPVASVASVAIETSDQESESAVSVVSTTTSNRNSPQPIPFPADAVASANRCISSLKSWIERVDNSSHQRPLASPSVHQQHQHPPQHPHPNFDLDYSNSQIYGQTVYGGHAQFIPSHNHSYQHPHHQYPQHHPSPYHGGSAYSFSHPIPGPHQPLFFNHAQFPYEPEPVAVAVAVATNTEDCGSAISRRERRASGRR